MIHQKKNRGHRTSKIVNKNRMQLQPRFKNHGCSHSPTPKEPDENIFYTQ